MTFTELVTFIADNWPIIAGVLVTVVPVVALIFRWLYSNRLAEGKAVQRHLQTQVDKLARASLERDKAHLASWSRSGAAPSVVPAEAGIQAFWPKTNEDSQANLLGLLHNAKASITVFGLTRNFYASEELRPVVLAKSQEVPVVLFMMAPDCESRVDRYRIEPIEAAMEDPARYRREIEQPFLEMLQRSERTEAGSRTPGLAIYYYNFPCSFAIEEIDDVIRVMLYGHGKRGTEGPILLLGASSPLAGYFQSQLRWLERLATQGVGPPWHSKGVALTRLESPGRQSNPPLRPAAEKRGD